MKFFHRAVISVLALVLGPAAVCAAAGSPPLFSTYEASSMVAVVGELDKAGAGSPVSLALIEKGASPGAPEKSQIGYLSQTKAAPDGSYQFQFRFTGNMDDYVVRVNQGGEVVTGSVKKAVSQREFFKVSLELNQTNTAAGAAATIFNLFAQRGHTYTLVLGFYGESGRLVGIKTGDALEVLGKKTSGALQSAIPKDTARIQAFVWGNSEKLLPLAPAREEDYRKITNVLAIGNSFSEDAAAYLHQIAAAGGVDLNIVNLYVGGCDLFTHWENARQNNRVYDYQKNGAATGRKVSIKEVLDEGDWDYITLQQQSGSSGISGTYYPYITDLAKYVKAVEPAAALLIHQTWAYDEGSDHPDFPKYNSSQQTMFAALKAAYQAAAQTVGSTPADDGSTLSPGGAPLRMIPSGEAFQIARANPVFDAANGGIPLCRDGYHASLAHGRYLLGAVWYEILTGNSVLDNSFAPDGVTEEAMEALKACAHAAAALYHR